MSNPFDAPFGSPQNQESKLRIEDYQDIYEYADSGQRLLNYFIDGLVSYGLVGTIIITISVFGVNNSAGSFVLLNLAMFLFSFLYYPIMEKTTGKTLGKMASKTRVVHVDGSPISWGQAFGRTLARMLPFLPFSVLFSDHSIGWHDSLSNTRVVRDRSHL